MDVFIALLAGIIIGGGIMFLVARNNQKKFNEALNIDPKAKAKEFLAELKQKINR